MQRKNSSRSMQPKSGDGTQDVRRKQDANWYGASQEPQEEFTSDHIGSGGHHGPVSAVEPIPARTTDGSRVDIDSGRETLTPQRANEKRTLNEDSSIERTEAQKTALSKTKGPKRDRSLDH